MKKLFFLSIIVLMAAHSGRCLAGNAENANESAVTVSISGQVLDRLTGEALAGVKVKVDETSSFSYTDFDGNFKINGLLPASYTVSVSMISYEETTLAVKAGSNENNDFLKVRLGQLQNK